MDVPLQSGVTLTLDWPPSTRDVPESALPVIDVSAVPGAAVLFRRGGEWEGGSLRAACVTAPSDRWAPGIEELVLGRASALATSGLGANVERWEPSAVSHVGSHYEQVLRGASPTNSPAWIRHVLAFAGSDHRVMLCSVGCYGAPQCENIVRSAAIHGAEAGVPPPSLLVRAVLLAAQKPYETGGLTAILVILVITVLLRFRRRVPGRSFFP